MIKAILYSLMLSAQSYKLNS